MVQEVTKRPGVGVGVIVVNDKGHILVGKREGDHAPHYSIPGGHLELGETFEQAAIREIKEETNLEIKNPMVVAVNNNLRTYREEGKHNITVFLQTKDYSGELRNMEPNKCSGWQWVDPNKLPNPHFESSEKGVKCYLKGKMYLSK